jgi:integrase
LDKTRIDVYLQQIDNFIGDLRAEGSTPGTVNNYVKGMKALFRVNGINLVFPYRLSKRVKYPDRSPTPEELSKVMDYANVKEKAVVSILALSGMRLGTLVKLNYKHVRNDLEKGIIPIHIHVEAEITKGKYHSYDTFIGEEAVKCLNTYLDIRRKGTAKLPPETLANESPLIRNECRNIVLPVSPASITSLVHKLFLKAGLIKKGKAKRYPIRPHSLRKYFRTQLGANSKLPTDYIDYMMGHKVSTYNDIRMKGIEFIRNLYALSGLSIKPKTRISKIETLKMLVESLGFNPDEVLSKDALAMPHRTIVDPESHQIKVLNETLKHAILKELKNA